MKDRSSLPIGVQHSCGVTPEQRYPVWQTSLFTKRYDRKCSSSTCFPIDRKVFGVDLEEA